MGSQACSQSGAEDSNEKPTFRRASASFHSLHSPRQFHNSKEYIWKKWKYTNKEKADLKYNELKIKQNNGQQYVISVLDVEMISVNKENYEIKAKVEFSDISLKGDVQKRSKTYNSYSIHEIWAITQRIVEIASYLAQNGLRLSEQMSSYLLVGSKMKAKDFSLFPGLKSQKIDPFNYSYSKTICRIVANIGLLVNQSDKVSLVEINRINLKYNPNLATFLYTLQSKEMSPKQILQLIEELKESPKIQIEPSIFKTESKPCLTKNAQKKRWEQLSNFVAVTDHKIAKTSSEQTLISNKSTSSLSFPQHKNLKRLQQIKPKQIKKSKLSLKSQFIQQQNKQNKQNNSQFHKKQSISIIEIDDHNFPQKVKQFRKTSATLSDLDGSLNREVRISQARNEAFIRLTGGSKCELFTHNEESLLESIIESEESIIVRSSESPVLNLDHGIESITQEFLKLQEQCIGEKQERVSVLELDYRRNSTIMEATEEYQESGDVSKSQEIKFQFLDSIFNNGSPFKEQGQQQDEEKFVIECYEGGSRYEGYVVKGVKHGFGKLYYEDGGSYEGHWKNGEIEGFGKLYYQSGELAYQGQWLKGEFHGEGKFINESPQQIVGGFNYKDFSDIGTSWKLYQGNFQHDSKHGYGTLILSNGQKFTGNWQKNNVQGDGILLSIGKKQIRGKWSNNLIVQIYEKQQANQNF